MSKQARMIAWMAVGVVVMCGLPVATRVRALVVEDSIHGSYYPVAKALERYCEEHGYAPRSLADLTPEYLGSLPTSRHVAEQIYSSSQTEPAWRLTLVSTSTGCKRLYIAEQRMPLSQSEKQMLVKQYHHAWYVLQP